MAAKRITRLLQILVIFPLLFLGEAILFPLPSGYCLDTPVTGPPDKLFGFAQSLLNKEEWDTAQVEFKRFIFLFPDHARVGEARFRISLCDFRMRRFDQALTGFTELAGQKPADKWTVESIFFVAACYEANAEWPKAESVYQDLISSDLSSLPHPAGIKDRARYLLGWVRAEQSRWLDAAKEFSAVTGPEYGPQAALLVTGIPAGQDLPLKSPVAAGIMSGVLPGLGQIYCDRPRDAAMSFLLNAAFVAGTVESYRQEAYVVGSILLMIEMGWYGGNIFNAVNNAHKYNRDLQRQFLDRLKEQLRVSVVPDPSGSAALWLTWAF
ncbi:MAG: hypothetical protein HQK58_13995 [Deltaproteobacteria bacterium]|nr:hypothetical protein [Deltaproteobacteria bacterium]